MEYHDAGHGERTGKQTAQPLGRDPLRKLCAKPRSDGLCRRDASPHRQIDRAQVPAVLGRRRECSNEGCRQADDHANGSGSPEALVHRQAGESHHHVGHDAAANTGEAGDDANAQTGDVPEIAIRRLSVNGRNRPGAAKRIAAINVNSAKMPVIRPPRR
jgi:hypothetical protein